MEDWIYSFPPIAHEEWLDQIRKDLKGKSPDSLTHEWWPGEICNPVIPSSPVEQIALPDRLFSNPPAVIESFSPKQINPGSFNLDLLDALSGGANQIQLNGWPGEFEEDWLNNVFPEMVVWQLLLSDNSIDIEKKPVGAYPSFFQKNMIMPTEGNSLPSYWSQAVEASHAGKSEWQFRYGFSADDAWDEVAAHIFNQFLQHKQRWMAEGADLNLFLKNVILSFAPTGSIYRQMIQTRTLILTWLNLVEYVRHASTVDVQINFETHIRPQQQESPDTFLIRASVASLAACLSGSTGIAIHHVEEHSPAGFYKRVDRNIHHLLHFESGLPKGKDPLAGAYAIDFYTSLWTQRIWERLSL